MARGNRESRSNPAPPPPPLLSPAPSLQQLDPAAALAAYEHVRRGTHAKALRILEKDMEKLGGLDSSPPFLLHAYRTAHKSAADVSADRKVRTRHFKSALEATRRVTEVAPGSIVLAHSYAMTLLGACRDMDEGDALATYETIIAECDRAVQIKEPSDPTLYHLLPADSDRRPTADGALSDLRELHQLVSEDLHRMRRYNEIKLKVAEFRRQQQLADVAARATSLAPSVGADQRTGSLEEQSCCEVVKNDDSEKCKRQSSVPQDGADTEKPEQIRTRLDSDHIGSTVDAYPNEQHEETPAAEETVECQVRIKDELNLKQFAEQSSRTTAPSESDNGTITSGTVCIHDDGADDYDRCFMEDLLKSIALSSVAEEVHGSGLKSDDDDKNCLLNVIIQHLRGFRDELLRTSPRHKHAGDPRVVWCVVCALCDIFIELGKVSKGKGEAVAPTSLRMALSNSSPTETLFQMRHMNDASGVLDEILRCVHDSYTYRVDGHAKSHENNLSGSWDCANKDCIAHNMFGANIFTGINCYSCGLGSRQLKLTLFLHHVNTGSLQRAMRMRLDNTFDDLLKTVIMNGHRTCDPDVGGCGKSNHINHTLSRSPHVFTVALGWQAGNGSVSDTLLSDILAAIGTEIDISVIYPGTTPPSKHSLVSMACFYNQRYICFAVNGEQWVLYDDQTARVVGDWIQVLIMCEEKKMQPVVLFFESAN